MSKGQKNVYVCQLCGGEVVTVDADEGVTPFMIECRSTPECEGDMYSSFYQVDQSLEQAIELGRILIKRGRKIIIKIDYESMIKSIKEELSRSAKLRDATIEYYRDRTAQGQMAELIGELVTKCNQLEREFLRVMEQHEKDSD